MDRAQITCSPHTRAVTWKQDSAHRNLLVTRGVDAVPHPAAPTSWRSAGPDLPVLHASFLNRSLTARGRTSLLGGLRPKGLPEAYQGTRGSRLECEVEH